MPWACRSLTILSSLPRQKRRNQPVNHLGITVSVKLGCAVERNRARRRIRETYRLNETCLKSGFDIVIVARKAAVDGPFDLLQKDFLILAKQLGLLEEQQDG